LTGPRRGFSNSVNFRAEVIHFDLNIGAIGAVVGVVRSLNSQFTHTLEDVFNFLVSAFGGVDQPLTIACIAYRLVDAADFRCQPRSNSGASCVIGGSNIAVTYFANKSKR
jgi:hypothetical protein